MTFHVNMVAMSEGSSPSSSVVSFRLDASDEDDTIPWEFVPESEIARTVHCQNVVRAVQHDTSSMVVIDSGADLSCLPLSYASSGRKVSGKSQLRVQDAQGGSLHVKQERIVEFVLKAVDDSPVIIKERCIVCDVTQPILSFGRLVKLGWFPCRSFSGDMWLSHASSGIEIPL